MTDIPPSRTVSESVVQMTEIVLPEDSNPHGSVFGGRVLSLIDKCAAVVAMRHARCHVVTLAFDSVVFLNKVSVGNVLLLSGRMNAAFGSSMEIEVEVHSEDPLSGERTLTTTALVTLVALDEPHNPCRVPRLQATDDDERQRASDAKDRRQKRLAARN